MISADLNSLSERNECQRLIRMAAREATGNRTGGIQSTTRTRQANEESEEDEEMADNEINDSENGEVQDVEID